MIWSFICIYCTMLYITLKLSISNNDRLLDIEIILILIFTLVLYHTFIRKTYVIFGQFVLNLRLCGTQVRFYL